MTVASVLGGAVAGELALIAAHLAMVLALVGGAALVGAAGELQPMIGVANAVGAVGGGISVFAVAGVVGGVACVVVGKSPALRERPPSERRALLIALGLGGPAALLCGALASSSPDLVPQMLDALVVCRLAVGRRCRRRCATSSPRIARPHIVVARGKMTACSGVPLAALTATSTTPPRARRGSAFAGRRSSAP